MTERTTDVPNASIPDELIVYLPHQELVTTQLKKLGVRVDRVADVDERLGLALLKLTRDGVKITELRGVLDELRTACAQEYGNWRPTVDNNRHVETVFGLPQPKSHATDDLTPAAGPVPVVGEADAGRGIRVGVLDTRVDARPDLIGRFVADRESLYRADKHPVPLRAGHATFVSSLVLAHAPAANLEVTGVLDENGRATLWQTVARMMEFADRDVQILNLSLGCRTEDGAPPLLLTRAVELLSRQLLIVAAAGNHNLDDTIRTQPTWPAALPDVVAVGARAGDDLADFSPRLPWITCTAPGSAVLGEYLDAHDVVLLDGTKAPFEGYATWSGTSFATAIASGAIAARTVRGRVTPREALAQLLAESAGVVRPYTQCDGGPRA